MGFARRYGGRWGGRWKRLFHVKKCMVRTPGSVATRVGLAWRHTGGHENGNCREVTGLFTRLHAALAQARSKHIYWSIDGAWHGKRNGQSGPRLPPRIRPPAIRYRF